MGWIDHIVIDCERPAALARFWAAALDGYAIRPYDDHEIARLAALGFTPETDPVVMVDGPGLTLCFQFVPEPKRVKNRVHLDVGAAELRVEVDRLCALGADVLARFEDRSPPRVTMADPECNEFCVVEREVNRSLTSPTTRHANDGKM